MSTVPDPAAGKPGGVRPPGFIYAIVGLLVAVLLLGTGAFMWLSGGGTASLVGGPFELCQDGSGKQVTDRDFRGKYMLVYFGYTFCPDVCPTTLNEVADALDHLGSKADRLQPIFITVDPKRDTPEVVKQYTAAFTPRLLEADRHSRADRRSGEGALALTMPSIEPGRDRTTTRWITAPSCT